MKTCEVCCEPLNKSNRKPTQCPYCPYEACASCSEQYLLNTDQDAHCMQCRKGWDRQILVANFSSKFVTKTYKERRENLLFDRERSLMPATQPYVELEIRTRKLAAEIAELNRELTVVNHRMGLIHASAPSLEDPFEDRIARQERVVKEHKIASDIRIEIAHRQWVTNAIYQRTHGTIALTGERRVFVRACPYTGCKGFLSTAWKCGLCELWTCPQCHEGRGPDKDAPHTCDPNNLETARLLARDSRNCPSCSAIIFKIDGCDQMWCTQCNTAFSWRRGTIETGVVHNPHFYEYQRRMGTLARNPGDVRCGGVPDWSAISHRWRLRNHPRYEEFASAHRSIGHIQWACIPRYTTDNVTDNRDLRVLYMINDIPELEFKRRIQKREKARQRKADIRQVCEMIVAVMSDLFQGLLETGDTAVFLESAGALKTHVNETMCKISARWSNCVTPKFILTNFDFR